MRKNTNSLVPGKDKVTQGTTRRIFLLVAALSTIAWGQSNHLVKTEFVAEAQFPKEPFEVGIRFSIEPDWYLYWKNPGDAGLPIEVTWDLPPGWKAGEIRFPLPAKFAHEDIVAYGYKSEVVLLVTITPSTKTVGPVKAKLDWLVCRESCVRGSAVAILDLAATNAEERARAHELLVRTRTLLPGTSDESGVLIEKTKISHNGEQWTLTATLGGSNGREVEDFYPDVVEGIVIAFNRISISEGTLTVLFTKQDESLTSVDLRGILRTATGGFEYSIPINVSIQ